ncbi:alpha-tocopherol transfer protein-like isoform X2 [Ixodes scapularis]|uniref:alpha-tocopherol transfer protein-like isoform X2 n=1 Tax=Ixodes scapularis TaxID=6945 RepID=UPI001A9F2DBA|nr:alpha-tocopherol transfer protein-like isoform X2 [Ixodes scapularis]
MDRMSSDLKIAAQRELGETLQVKRNAVEQLRKRLAEEPELQCPLDEEFLVKFLRGRKYRVEEAFENIRKYFRVRMDHADIFDNLLPSRIMFDTIFHQKKLVTILKKPDSLGRRILLVKFGAWDPQVCPLNEYFRAGIVVLECGLLNQMAQIAGVVGVADLDGLKISHLLYFTPSEIRKLIKLVQFRFIGRDYEKLHKLIPRDRLPEEYGGTLEPFDYEDYERSLRSQENYFVELGRYGYREKHSENESRDSA